MGSLHLSPPVSVGRVPFKEKNPVPGTAQPGDNGPGGARSHSWQGAASPDGLAQGAGMCCCFCPWLGEQWEAERPCLGKRVSLWTPHTPCHVLRPSALMGPDSCWLPFQN